MTLKKLIAWSIFIGTWIGLLFIVAQLLGLGFILFLGIVVTIFAAFIWATQEIFGDG